MDIIDNQLSEEELAEKQRHIDFLRKVDVPNKPEHNRAKMVVITISLLILLAIGVGAYLQLSHNKNNATTKNQSNDVAKSSSSKSTPATVNVPTQSYNSSDFNLGLNYPDGWTVVDSGNGPMTVTSPAMQLNAADGSKDTGQIIMTIQKQGQLPAAFTAGSALAVLNSQLISYSQPTPSQTSQTYLSFVQYSSTTSVGGLDGIYVTGNYGYQKDQVVPDSDITSIDPLITVTFIKCGNSKCTSNLNPLTVASTSWNNDAFQAPIKTMLSSLTFN